jgi:outer membrane protein assembly factor BamB/mono/diheme cytochrome c family protein
VTSPAPKFLLGGNDKKHLYHNSTLALNADTGKIVWHYQHVVDHWDLDHTFERILLDTEVTPARDSVSWINPRVKPGQKYEVVTGIPGKTGIVYTLDRRTGEFLWARPTVYQNVVAKIDGRSGAVTINPQTLFSKKGDAATVCPSIQGGKNWPAGAYSPLTGTMYFPLQNTCAHYTSITSSRREPSNYGLRADSHITPGTQNLGTIHAISASSGKLEWKYEQRAAILSLLTTGGGLLFGGDVAGRFRAFDQRTGAVLWEINLGSQVTGFPIAYAVRGKQYVAVSVGRAVATSQYALLTPEIRVSNNNSLFIFALPESGLERTTRASDRTPSSITQSALPVATGPSAPQCQRTNRPLSASSTTADGAFSAAQSAQGKQLYTTEQCALCHGESMRGSAGAPALADAGFLLAWEGRPLSALFDCMKSTMPPGRAGALSDREYMQLLAAILHANGFSPGESAELSADPEKLNRIALKRRP